MMALALTLALFQSPALPPEFQPASEFLFAHGMTDPKGGELRWVKIWMPRSSWPGEEKYPAATTGWVMPSNGKTLHAIWHDGLSYTVQEVGPLVTSDELKRSATERVFGTGAFKSASIAQGLLGVNFITLLVRTGYSEEARMLWGTNRHADDPTREMYTDFLGALSSRAHQAFQEGNFALSKWDSDIFLREKPAFQAAFKAEYDRKGFTDPMRDEFAPFVGIDSLNKVAADRAANPRPILDLEANRKLPKEQQVANIVAAFDGARDFRPGDWGGLNIDSHPYVEELIKLGEPAIEPLIRACEEDHRMTQAIEYQGRTTYGGAILPAWKLAAAALNRLLLHPDFPRVETQVETARQYREYWKEVGHLNQGDRLIGILESDPTPNRSLSAAGALTKSREGWATLTREQQSKVMALLNEKAKTYLSDSVNGAPRSWQYAYLMAQYGGRVDEKAALPTLRLFCETTSQNMKLVKEKGQSGQAGTWLGAATTYRLRAGDKSAVGDYLKGIRGVDLDRDSMRSLEWVFQPVILTPQVPELQSLGRRAFAKGSSWDLRGRISGLYISWPASRALLVPSFYDMVIEELGNPQVVFTGAFMGESVTFEYFRVGSTHPDTANFPIDEQDGTRMQPVKGQIEIAVRDVYAFNLAMRKMKGAPDFCIYWPKERRDAAAKAWVTYLKKNRSQLRTLLDASEWRTQDAGAWDLIKMK
jgi:hypothetical protein